MRLVRGAKHSNLPEIYQRGYGVEVDATLGTIAR